MENYQTVGVFVSVIGMFLGLIGHGFWLHGGMMFFINLFTLVLSVLR